MSVDLSALPAPAVLEELDFEQIFQAKRQRFAERCPQHTAALEAEPVVKLLELCAYDEMVLRSRVNDAARSLLLAYAVGSDLDHLAALLGVERLVVDPGDADAVPPVPPRMEDDERLRMRAQLALEGATVAGSRNSYRYWAMTADAHAADVAVYSPSPGVVSVVVLSDEGDGVPLPAMLDRVEQALSADDVRPLTDLVQAEAAVLVPFTVSAVLHRVAGPEGDVAEAAARSALAKYVAKRKRLGLAVAKSGLDAALHQPGIVRVELISPVDDVICQLQQVATCTSVSLAVEVSNER